MTYSNIDKPDVASFLRFIRKIVFQVYIQF